MELTQNDSRRKRQPLRSFPQYFDQTFLTRPYNFTDNGKNYSGDMSDKVSVILLPRAFESPGSTPGSDQLEPITSFLRTKYPQYNFIKGHMWNQEIGGEGKTENLVPLTSAANSSHKNNAEQPLKNALRNFDNFYTNNKPVDPDYDKVYGFKYIVEIENAFWSGVHEQIVPNSIHVQILPIKCDAGLNVLGDESIISKAIAIPTKNYIERLRKGIWIDQNGVVHDG